jgi:hypothetical protein
VSIAARDTKSPEREFHSAAPAYPTGDLDWMAIWSCDTSGTGQTRGGDHVPPPSPLHCGLQRVGGRPGAGHVESRPRGPRPVPSPSSHVTLLRQAVRNGSGGDRARAVRRGGREMREP